MSEDEAELLATEVRRACGDQVTVVPVAPDAPHRAVEVTRLSPGAVETFILYDREDWQWLKDRIATT